MSAAASSIAPARILFSPVGDSDPMRDYHDGSLLHIARHYHPDMVQLYLSAEMLAREEHDSRYTAALHLLGIPQDAIELIRKPDLSAAHQYDFFIHEFRDRLIVLHEQFPDSEIILNVTSGTPAMKSALITLNALHEFSMTAVQVASPRAGSNAGIGHEYDESLDAQWELNEDKNPNAPSRCSEIKPAHLGVLLKYGVIKGLVQHYDYHAALRMSRSIERYLPSEVIRTLEACVSRLELRICEARKQLGKSLANRLLPKVTGVDKDRERLYEYLQVLGVKLKIGAHADFCRAYTPAVTQTLLLVLDAKTEYKSSNLVDKSGMLTTKVINEDALLKLIFGSSGLYLKNSQLVELLEKCLPKDDLLKRVTATQEIDGRLRNLFAHQLREVPADFIKRYQPRERLDDLQNLLYECSNGASYSWDSFERINQYITDRIDTYNLR